VLKAGTFRCKYPTVQEPSNAGRQLGEKMGSPVTWVDLGFILALRRTKLLLAQGWVPSLRE
jgi:hypothetical protein